MSESVSWEAIAQVAALAAGRTYHVVTYGCQMNVHDSEKLAGMLEEMKLIPAQQPEDADVLVFNTCCVREHAEDRVYSNIGALKIWKQNKPHGILAVGGCMMQEPGGAQGLYERFGYVDIIFGTHNLHKFPEYLYTALTSGRVRAIEEHPGTIVEELPVRRAPGHRAWLTIMYGCNNFCNYCIVPYVRGRERSRSSDMILEEARGLLAEGYKEITLLGQNVNSYGMDLADGIDFPQLLRKLDALGVPRIRFMTSHPKDLSDGLIDAMAECSHVCSHIHLPVQSGSDDVLQCMNRKYTAAQYKELVRKLRERVPDVGITTDIIVGFPGETEEDFAATLRLVEDVGFDSAFTFLYSPRVGTKAADFSDQISEETKKQRFNRLLETVNRYAAIRSAEYIGRHVEVLVEGASDKNPNVAMGRTGSFKTVLFPLPEDQIPLLTGQCVEVTIKETSTWALKGIISQ